MPGLAFDPVASDLLSPIDSTELRHPLAPGGGGWRLHLRLGGGLRPGAPPSPGDPR